MIIALILAFLGLQAFGETSSTYQAVTYKVEKTEKISTSDLKDLVKAYLSREERQFLQKVGLSLAKNPNDPQVLNLLALHSMRERQHDLAKIVLNRALASSENNPGLLNNLGVIALREGRIQRAVTFFRRAIAGGSESARLNMAGLQIEFGDFQGALGSLQQAYSKVRKNLNDGDPNTVAIANNFGVALMGSGSFKEAEKVFEEIAKVFGKEVKVLLNYAILLVEKIRQPDKARPVLNKLKFSADQPKVLQRIESLEKQITSVKE